MKRFPTFLAIFAFLALLSTEPGNAQAGETQFRLLKETGLRTEAVPYLDVALDVARFRSNAASQSLTDTLLGLSSPFRLADTNLAVSALSVDLVLQLPLSTSTTGPSSDRLRPYLAIGPQAIVITEDDETTKYALPKSHQPDLTTSFGVKIGAGMSWQLQESLGLFGEYRYFRPELNVDSLGAQTTPGQALNDYLLIGGLSFRF